MDVERASVWFVSSWRGTFVDLLYWSSDRETNDIMTPIFSETYSFFFAKQPDFLCIFSDIAEFIEPAHPCNLRFRIPASRAAFAGCRFVASAQKGYLHLRHGVATWRNACIAHCWTFDLNLGVGVGLVRHSPFSVFSLLIPSAATLLNFLQRTRRWPVFWEAMNDVKMQGNVSRRQTIHSLKALSRISTVQSGWTLWCDRCTFWHLPLWGFIFSIPMKARPSSHQQVLCLGVTKLHSNCLDLVPDRFIMFNPSWLQPKLSLGCMQSHLSSVLRTPFQLPGFWPMGLTEKGVTESWRKRWFQLACCLKAFSAKGKAAHSPCPTTIGCVRGFLFRFHIGITGPMSIKSDRRILSVCPECASTLLSGPGRLITTLCDGLFSRPFLKLA